MKKRIIALVLSIIMILSLLPAQAIAASFANTTEGKKSAHKTEVSNSLEAYRQMLVETLDASIAYFECSDNYSKEVWDLAQNLYKAEVERINQMTSLAQMVNLDEPSIFGYSANDTTIKVMNQLEFLSELDLSEYKTASDIEFLKNELREDLDNTLEDFKKSDFNDFYWDRVVSAKEDFNALIDEVSDCLDYADYRIVWSNTEIFIGGFNYDDDDEDDNHDYSIDISELINQYIVSNGEIEGAVNSISEILEEYITEYLPNRGYKGKTDKLYDMIDSFEQKALKVDYVKQILDVANDTFAQMILYTGKNPMDDTNKPVATNSDKIRVWDKLSKYFIANFSKRDYSEDGWYELAEICDEYQAKIQRIEYKEDLKADKLYNDFIKELKKIKTYVQELKELKTDCIDELKFEYLGNPKYNQKKVKPIVVEGIKKINAAKKLEQVDKLFDAYCKKANATVNKYKIVTSKSGAGAVSASKTVNYGSSYTVKIVPKAGYKIKAITVDGRKIKLTNAYTFREITKSHKIKVTFGK